MKIKKILITQPTPDTAKSPYFDLAEKNNVQVDFRPFIQVEGVTAKEFRQTRIQILDHTGVIFTSRSAIDHFFRMSSEMRVTIPDSMKYFCVSEATAFYLQKYIVYRKRKIFYGAGKFSDLIEVMKKHKEEKFLLPVSQVNQPEILQLLDKAGYQYTPAIIYKTVSSDLSDLKDVNYDILVFFTPAGIQSLIQNFPQFEQNCTKIACFGSATAKAVLDAGLRLDIEAPTTEAPSMTMALEQYIKKNNK